MSSSLSCTSKPLISSNNGKTFNRRTIARSQVIIGALERSKIRDEKLSIQEIPQINQQIFDIIQRQKSLSKSMVVNDGKNTKHHTSYLEEAYEECRKIYAQESTTFYLGTLLLPKAKQRALWAFYAWCKRIDNLVDDPDAVNMSCNVLDEWEARLEDIFSGRPHDMLDTAFFDTISNFHLDIKPFQDMLEGMRMDTYKTRYANFEEIYQYSYYVSGTATLTIMPILGIAPVSSRSQEKIYRTALYFAIASQLTNILRDVAEDATRGRVYLPQDELGQFGLSDEDIFSKKVSSSWREFIKEQIKRARFYYDLAEEGYPQLPKAARWTVWLTSMLSRMILDEIELNNYDNLTKRARVGMTKKLMALPLAYVRAHQLF